MSRRNQSITLAVSVLLLSLLGLALLLISKHAKADPMPAAAQSIVPLSEVAIKDGLEKAPWHGLRFLKEQNTWRFYGLTSETRQIDLIQPVDLVKVYYLEPKGNVNFTWAATEIHFPGQPSYSLTTGPVQPNQRVAIDLAGDYVNEQGVDWEKCDLEVCHFAQLVDTMIILDDQGTGLSNGFVRYGWEPPTYPYYGFLCWKITQLDEQFSSADISEGR